MQGGIWLNSQHLFIPQDLPQACPLLFRGPGLQHQSSGNSHVREPQESLWLGVEGRDSGRPSNSNLHVSASSFKRRGVTNVIMAI